MTELTQKYVKELFDYKNGFLYWKIKPPNQIQIGDKAGRLNNDGYCHIKINYKIYKTHRLIFLYFKGFLPKFIDHIDGNRSNNKIENLREVTQAQNNRNSKSNIGSSQYKGVAWHKQNKYWVSYITYNYKRIHLGIFINEKDAAKAYNKAAKELFDEYANLNKVE